MGSGKEVIINKQGDTLPLKEALTSHFEITLLSKKILNKQHNLQIMKCYISFCWLKMQTK